jgi:hypothetical protein
MESSMRDVPRMDKTSDRQTINHPIRNSDGSMVGRIRLHEGWPQDGSVRAQLELRFEDFVCALTAPEVGLDASGYSPGRTWVLVEVEPRQGYTDTLRFSIHIPGKPGHTREDILNAQAAIAAIDRAREAIRTVREGCTNPKYRDYFLHLMDEIGDIGQLANDGSEPSLVTLASQPLHPQSPDS